MRRPFLLKQRGKIWYYRLAGHATFHSTGQTSKTAAMNYAQEALARNEPPPRPRLQDYTADFYRWDTCEWIRRQHAKGRRFSRQVADARRSQLDVDSGRTLPVIPAKVTTESGQPYQRFRGKPSNFGWLPEWVVGMTGMGRCASASLIEQASGFPQQRGRRGHGQREDQHAQDQRHYSSA